MKIIKPIVFFDLETTGLDIKKDRIVEIAMIKLHPDGKREEKKSYINPEMPIPLAVSEFHGITDETVKDAPTFKSIAKALISFFFGCDLGGFNCDRFDIPLLIEEFQRCDIEFPTWEVSVADVRVNEYRKTPSKLSDLYLRYVGSELEDAHSALADINATITVLEAQQSNEPEMTIQEIDLVNQGDKKRFDLAGKTYIKDDVVYWAFGKHINKPVLGEKPGDKVAYSYLEWVLNNDFPLQTKRVLRELLTQK